MSSTDMNAVDDFIARVAELSGEDSEVAALAIAMLMYDGSLYCGEDQPSEPEENPTASSS